MSESLSSPRSPLILEGLCRLTEMEGGFHPMDIEVDGESIDILLARHVDASWPGVENSSRPYALREGSAALGRVRITVEFLSDGDAHE